MKMSELIGLYLVLINLVAFCLYGIDKWKAKKQKWRIPEKTLFLVAGLGGSFGAGLGMRVFRHKTKHRSFTIGIPLILVAQCALVVFLVWYLQK